MTKSEIDKKVSTIRSKIKAAGGGLQHYHDYNLATHTLSKTYTETEFCDSLKNVHLLCETDDAIVAAHLIYCAYDGVIGIIVNDAQDDLFVELKNVYPILE